MRRSLTALAAVFAVTLQACAPLQAVAPSPRATPPVETAVAPKPQGALVAAANPLAAEAGLEVLRRGGSAVDAAVAIQAVLGLVEPQSSGLGGGAFIAHYDAETRQVTVYDGRETAPAGARPDMFLGPDGEPLPYARAVTSGRATGAPGVVPALHAAWEDHGQLPWSALFGAAERLAEDGFVVSPRLARFAAGSFPQNALPDVRAYFRKADGTPVVAGDVLKNPAYARTVRALAADPRALHRGAIGRAIVEKTRQEPLPGTLTEADLAAYQARVREAVCTAYRVWIVCAPPPPSSGVAVLQALELLERTPAILEGRDSPAAWLALGEAQRLMYADRDRYVGDPAFVEVPVAGLLDPAYLDARARLIGERAGPAPRPGSPPGAGVRAPDATREPAGTSHFVVVDREGNAVSMTTTVESLFGSGRMVEGFFLNNQLTDFSFSPLEPDGVSAANAVAPGKRPRSSMAPIVVLDREGRLVAALGSPGGTAILSYNLKTLVGVLDWGLTMQEAIDLPNLIARGEQFGAETSRFSPALIEGLRARGATLTPGRGEGSGLHGVIVREGGRLEGGADPRREGVVLTLNPSPTKVVEGQG
jgi:gamma-glutamyltranspeptidase/glutathione hydrolase